jgi:hypothetical protein
MEQAMNRRKILIGVCLSALALVAIGGVALQ